MADKGPGDKELIRKRCMAEIKRLEASIEAQELEIMESYEKNRRLEENIAASKEGIKQQELNIEALDKGGEDD